MAKRSRDDIAEIAADEERFKIPDQDYAQSPTKWIHRDSDSEDADSEDDMNLGNARRSAKIECIPPPHKSPWHFDSYEAYETHVESFHNNRCYECNCNLPSQHYLRLHMSEHHDPFDAMKREKGDKTYACLVEGCDRLCSSPPKRRLHCIDKHNFPRNYNFAVLEYGIDPRMSKHRHRAFLADRQARRQDFRKREAQTQGEDSLKADVSEAKEKDSKKITEVAENTNGIEKDGSVESVTSSLNALKFQPRSLKFGRKGNAGLGKS